MYLWNNGEKSTSEGRRGGCRRFRELQGGRPHSQVGLRVWEVVARTVRARGDADYNKFANVLLHLLGGLLCLDEERQPETEEARQIATTLDMEKDYGPCTKPRTLGNM